MSTVTKQPRQQGIKIELRAKVDGKTYIVPFTSENISATKTTISIKVYGFSRVPSRISIEKLGLGKIELVNGQAVLDARKAQLSKSSARNIVRFGAEWDERFL